MLTKIYSWILSNKKLVLSVCVILILILIVNILTNDEAAKEEKWLEEQEQKILEMEKSKEKKIEPIDHKLLGNKHFNLWDTKKGDVIEHYVKAIEHFEAVIVENAENLQNSISQSYSSSTSSPIDSELFYKLAKLFHIGVSDGYYRNGLKRKGVVPNVQKALHYYMISAQMGNPEGLLSVADLYRWGLQELKPNVEYSKQLYMILRQTGDDYYKGIAKDRILQMKEDDGSVIGAGVDAGNFNTQFHEAFENYGQGTLQGDDDFDANLDHKNADVSNLMTNLKIPQMLHANPNTSIDDKQSNNPHNVTDHVLDNTIKQIWTKLKANTPELMNTQTVFLDIKRYILSQRDSEDKKQDALKTLAEIANGVDSRSYEEAQEIDAIVLIWNRIHANINTENKNILKQNLYNELAESVEHGEVVCRKGRIARLFDALNFIDPDVQIKPKWAINEEMRNAAIKLKNDSLKRAQPHVRDAAESAWPSPEQVELVNKFNEKFKRDLIELFHKKYVDTGCMSSDLLKTEMKKWVDHL